MSVGVHASERNGLDSLNGSIDYHLSSLLSCTTARTNPPFTGEEPVGPAHEPQLFVSYDSAYVGLSGQIATCSIPHTLPDCRHLKTGSSICHSTFHDSVIALSNEVLLEA